MKRFSKFTVFVFFISLYSCALYDLDKPCTISFTIVDSAGKGIEGVSVTYTSDSENGESVTGSDGKTSIRLSKGGVCIVSVSKTEFTKQSKEMVVLSGQNKQVDIILTSLSEDAYLSVDSNEILIYNTGHTFTVDVITNMNYEIETSASWISCTKSLRGFVIQCDSNHTEFERNATIFLHADYNMKDSLKIKQMAGPVLRVVDYTGMNQTSFPTTVPFITFSREITVVNANNAGSDIAFELSADKKTIYFTNIKLNLFSVFPITVNVKASDNVQLIFSMNLQLFVGFQAIPAHSDNTTFFTKDNAYCWIYTSNYQSKVLKQYSIAGFKETKQITNLQFNSVTYNPYNNGLYLLNYKFFEDRYITEVKVIDATTGLLNNEFEIDYNGSLIESIAFTQSGYGLMRMGSMLMYIDAAKNHEIGVYTDSRSIYDRSHPEILLTRFINTFGNYSLFVLNGEDSSGNDFIYSSVPGSRVISQILSSNQYQNTYSSNSGTKAVLTYSDASNLRIVDLISKVSKVVTLPSIGVNNVVFIADDDGKQFILTTRGSLISLDDYSIQNFKSQANYYYMHSSADGKFVIINKNGIDYLYRSAIFTDFSNYIY